MTANAPTDVPSPIFEYRIHAVEGKVEKTNDELKALTLKLSDQFSTAITTQATLYTSILTGTGVGLTLVGIAISIGAHKLIKKYIQAQVIEKIDSHITQEITPLRKLVDDCGSQFKNIDQEYKSLLEKTKELNEEGKEQLNKLREKEQEILDLQGLMVEIYARMDKIENKEITSKPEVLENVEGSSL
jgi:hypothetical protein